ncbi:MAG: DNA-methyltransferase [Candidatus Thorarchaeota archaeon]
MKIELNNFYCMDNLELMKELPDLFIDLIYIDIPFFSQKDYEDFNDKWENIEDFLKYIEIRLKEIYRILKLTGSFYLHCDPKSSHYLKIILDDIFGYNNFRNEIIWSYRRWTAIAKQFQNEHDIILFYTKSDNYTFNPLYDEYNDNKAHYKHKDDKGIFRWQHKKGNKYKVYLNEKGVRMGDVWFISYLNSMSNERTGYSTQKPESLLERIILASSKKEDLIVDLFCGSGTTCIVAKKLERNFIGCDINPKAIEICNNRLNSSEMKKIIKSKNQKEMF